MSARAGDAAVLAAAIEERHPDPFRGVDRDVLLREVARVDAIDSHDRSVLTVELMRMIALLSPRNGHTAIHPLDDHPTTQYAYPLGLYEFEDGVFVTAAGRSDLVGAELVAVEGVDIHHVLQAVTPLIAYDNEWTIRSRRPTFVIQASVLRGLGLAQEDRRATFRLRTPIGPTVDVDLGAIGIRDFWSGLGSGDWFPDNPPPAHVLRLFRNEWHWAERTAEGAAVHVGYIVTLGDTAGFACQVDALAAAPGVRLVILDLRHNGGGDNRTYGPLLQSMERLSDTTRLAVLTSRTTFSAAMQLVVDLEEKTTAVFVGEPTGGSPNSYGDATPVPLASSGLNAAVATIAWMTADESDHRLTRDPDIPVAQESQAYFAGEDPTLDAAVAALSYGGSH